MEGMGLARMATIDGSDGPLGREQRRNKIRQDTNLEREGVQSSTTSRASMETLKITARARVTAQDH